MYDKKAIAELVAYVLLIGLAISLSVIVYNWLKFYVKPYAKNICPDGVSIVIIDYSCEPEHGQILNLKISNKGLFNINGTLVKINYKDEGLPIYSLIPNTLTFPKPFKPGDINTSILNYSNYAKITEIQLEPFIIVKENTILCDKAVISQKTTPESGCG